MPCQHMFMVLQRFTIQFDWLWPLFRASPFFKIDQAIINSELNAKTTSTVLQELISEPVQGPSTIVSTVLAAAKNGLHSNGDSHKIESVSTVKKGLQSKVANVNDCRTKDSVLLKDDKANLVEKSDHRADCQRAISKEGSSNLKRRIDLTREDSGFEDATPTMASEPQQNNNQEVPNKSQDPEEIQKCIDKQIEQAEKINAERIQNMQDQYKNKQINFEKQINGLQLENDSLNK